MKTSLIFLQLTIFILAGQAAHAQLQSERPMLAIAPKYLKDGSPKQQPSFRTLPSENKMPEVKAPKGSTIPKRKNNVQADPARLPSNSKTRIKDLVKKPKVKN